MRSFRGCPNISVAGDTNINYLTLGGWQLPHPPFPLPVPVPDEDAELVRRGYEQIAEFAGLSAHLPDVVLDAHGGPWGFVSSCLPVTRIPVGAQASCCWPGVLDHALLPSQGASLEVSWQKAPADHAVLFVTSPIQQVTVSRKKARAWRPADEATFLEALNSTAATWPTNAAALCTLPELLVHFCERWRDFRPRRVRKAARVPLQARHLLAEAARATDEGRRKLCKASAWQLIRRQQRSLTGKAVKSKVAQGRPLAKKVKLHTIEGINMAGDGAAADVVVDEAVACAAVRGVFEQRWACKSLHRREQLRDLLGRAPGAPLQWTWKEFQVALNAIDKKFRADHDGECVAMWQFLFMVVPDLVLRYFGWLAAQSGVAAATHFHARALGKKSKVPRPKDIRIVIPLSARAQILDALLAARISQAADSIEKEGWFVAAVPGMQPLDISFGTTQMTEKAMDDRSRGAWASMDIEAYYDNVDLLLVAAWLRRARVAACDAAVIAAALRWQLLPCVEVDATICTLVVRDRIKGGLTGSRTAGALGRIPVEATMNKISCWVRRWAFDVGTRYGLSGASFVDNLFCFSHSAGGALQAAQLFERVLNQDWRLRIKDGSRELLLVAGAAEWGSLPELVRRWPGWQVTRSLACLGVLVSNDGSIGSDLEAWKKAVMAAMLRNTSGLARSVLSLKQKERHMNAFGTVLLDFRCPRWPVSPAAGRFLDAAQRRVIAGLLELPRRADEDIDGWQRRRSRECGAVAREWGLWSLRHEERARRWQAHITRDHAGTMAGLIYRWRGRAWRAEQRQRAGSGHRDAGRLGTRVLSHVNLRWEDSLAARS